MDREVVHDHRAAEVVAPQEEQRYVAEVYEIRRASARARVAERDVVLFEEDKKKENEAKSDVTEIKLKRSKVKKVELLRDNDSQQSF